MGFIIDKNLVVHHDPHSNEFADTQIANNPTQAITHCAVRPLTVHSLILRLRTKSQKKYIGDNCPLIYALKKRDGLSVTLSSIKPMIPIFNKLLDKFCTLHADANNRYDAIIPMPSSHPLTCIIAKRLSQRLGAPIAMQYLRKATPRDIHQQLLDNQCSHKLIPHPARQKILNAIKIANEQKKSFSISLVATKYRKSIDPLACNDRLPTRFSNILLVDDLFASGRTLISAKDMFISQHPQIRITAFCLFSPHNGRVKKS